MAPNRRDGPAEETMAQNITPKGDDYPQWYLDVIKAGDLAEHSPVRGCMVIKPHGYAIWEMIQDSLDRQFKTTGHVNAYFPLFIPQSFHREGSGARRGVRDGVCGRHALTGSSRIRKAGLRPAARCEEPLIVRPTSETIIGQSFAQLGAELSRPAAAA
jgi:prolyl-tRNA synthetase